MENFTPTPYTLECVATGREFEDAGWMLADPQCKETSLVRTKYARKQIDVKPADWGLYRFSDWMPVRRILKGSSAPVTYKSKGLAAHLGLENLWITFNGWYPAIGATMSTCSFKETEAFSVCARAAEDEEREKFARGNKDFEHIKTLGYYAMAAFNTSTRLFDGLMYLVVILAGGLSLVYGRITAGDLVAYMLYVTTLIATIRRIVEFAEQFQRGMTGIERFAEIMDTPVAIQDAPDAVPLQPGPGAIRFENVSFEYPDDHNKVLHDISLDIHAGERLALVGASGGGKTTLCNLIPRFYEVTDGRILIDGQDIQHVTLKSLREDIGIVQQDVYLFSGSVADNIAYGKPDATDEEIEHLKDLCDTVEYKIEHDLYYIQDDIDFHTYIARCSKNKVVEQIISIIETAVLMFVNLTHRRLRQETIITHRAITKSIAEHDPVGARSAMTMHISYNRAAIKEIYDARNRELENQEQ